MLKIIIVIFSLGFIASCSSGEKKEMKADQAKMEESKAGDKAAMKKDEKMTAGGVTCTLKNDKRTIEVVKAGNGCEVAYTKFNETKTVATSVNGTEHCEGVQERMKNNLASAGFTCN